jgi:hypothetical protein
MMHVVGFELSMVAGLLIKKALSKEFLIFQRQIASQIRN